MATQAGWDVHKAFDVIVKANMDYWTPYSNFIEGGCGILNAAKDLHLNVLDIKNILTQVGIDSRSCAI